LQRVGGNLRQCSRMPMALAHRTRVDYRSSARVDSDPRALPAAPVEANIGEAARRGHAAHLGVGSDTNAAITPDAAETLLLLTSSGVIECSGGFVETALVIAAVINHRLAAVRVIRKFRWQHEIDPPHFNWVETEMAGDRFNGPLGDVGSLGPPVAPISVDRHC